jgi:hypothetical protein
VVSVPLPDGIDTVTGIPQPQMTYWVNQVVPDLFVSPTGRFRKMHNLITDMPIGALALRVHVLLRTSIGTCATRCFDSRDFVGITSNADYVAGNVLNACKGISRLEKRICRASESLNCKPKMPIIM